MSPGLKWGQSQALWTDDNFPSMFCSFLLPDSALGSVPRLESPSATLEILLPPELSQIPPPPQKLSRKHPHLRKDTFFAGPTPCSSGLTALLSTECPLHQLPVPMGAGFATGSPPHSSQHLLTNDTVRALTLQTREETFRGRSQVL